MITHSGFRTIDVTDYDYRHWNPSQLGDEIERIWKAKTREEFAKGGTVYNGQMMRVIDMTVENATLHVRGQATDYAHHVATRGNPELERRANPLFAALIVYSKEGRMMFETSGSGVESRNYGKRNIIAGAVDPTIDVIPTLPEQKRVPDPYLTLFRETFEETGLHLRNDLNGLRPRFVMKEETEQHPSIIFEARLNMSEKRAKMIFDLNKEMRKVRGEEIEADDIIFLGSEELAQYRDTFHGRIQVLMKDLGA